MILADTSIWVEHFKKSNSKFVSLLQEAEIACHPFVIGELACGNLKNRRETLTLLAALPQCDLASHKELLEFIDQRKLAGRGVGWVDINLLASTVLDNCLIWTKDKRLHSVAEKLGISF